MLAALVAIGMALSPEVEAAAQAARDARAALVADAGNLWGQRLDGVAWCFVAGERLWFTEQPDDPAYVAEEGLWMGPIPRGVSPANTAVSIARRRWAMVMLPLPADRAAAQRLLVHEAFHVVEPDLLAAAPADEGVAGAGLLDEPAGRTWLILEWRALAQALVERGPAEKAAVERALAFRARRYFDATPGERARERLLDITEGMAEYTAWKLAGGGEEALPRILREEAPAAASFVRTFPYVTGPAYGFLLDRRAPGWRAKLRATPDLQRLLARGRAAAWLDGRDVAGLVRTADREGARMGLAQVLAGEEARWQEHAKVLADLRARYVHGPTLRLRPGPLRVSFDYRGQLSLGAAGTYMPGVVWRDEAGARLDAPAGALITADWKELVVPLPNGPLPEERLTSPLDLEGDGWKLHLPAGWTVRREGESVVIVP